MIIDYLDIGRKSNWQNSTNLLIGKHFNQKKNWHYKFFFMCMKKTIYNITIIWFVFVLYWMYSHLYFRSLFGVLFFILLISTNMHNVTSFPFLPLQSSIDYHYPWTTMICQLSSNGLEQPGNGYFDQNRRCLEQSPHMKEIQNNTNTSINCSDTR